MELIGYAVVALLAGMAGAMAVDARFWLGFAREVYRHHPGNHLCNVVECCR